MLLAVLFLPITFRSRANALIACSGIVVVPRYPDVPEESGKSVLIFFEPSSVADCQFGLIVALRQSGATKSLKKPSNSDAATRAICEH
jgi:hypothetical protein